MGWLLLLGSIVLNWLQDSVYVQSCRAQHKNGPHVAWTRPWRGITQPRALWFAELCKTHTAISMSIRSPRLDKLHLLWFTHTYVRVRTWTYVIVLCFARTYYYTPQSQMCPSKKHRMREAEIITHFLSVCLAMSRYVSLCLARTVGNVGCRLGFFKKPLVTLWLESFSKLSSKKYPVRHCSVITIISQKKMILRSFLRLTSFIKVCLLEQALTLQSILG